MATVRKVSILKLNTKENTVAESMFINREREVTQRASVYPGATLQIHYNSEGHFNPLIDVLEGGLTSDHTGTWITPTVTHEDNSQLTTPVAVTIPLWNVIYIFELPNGKARIVFLKRIVAGQPVTGYVDCSQAFSAIQGTIS